MDRWKVHRNAQEATAEEPLLNQISWCK